MRYKLLEKIKVNSARTHALRLALILSLGLSQFVYSAEAKSEGGGLADLNILGGQTDAAGDRSPYEILKNLYDNGSLPTRINEIPTQRECVSGQKRMKTLLYDVSPETSLSSVEVLDGYFTNDDAKFISRFATPPTVAKGPLFPSQPAVPEISSTIKNFFTVNDCKGQNESVFDGLAVNRDKQFIFFRGKQYLNYNLGFSLDLDKYAVAETAGGLVVRWIFVNLDESFLDQITLHFRSINKDVILIKVEQKSKPGRILFNYLWRSP